MAILGFFKRDKSKASSSQASSSTVPAALDDTASTEDYVLSPPSFILPTVANGDDGYTSSSASFVSAASSKKMKLPFTKKSSTACPSPLTRQHEPGRSVLSVFTDLSSLSLSTTLDATPRASVFPSFHNSSSPTLPRPDPNTRPKSIPVQKSDSPAAQKSGGGLFTWRERRKSKASKPDLDTLVLPPLADDSFNLKSFRHVLPEPRSNSPQNRSPVQSPSSSSLVPPPRPRGASVASTDSAQRISVAAFREAQARRSSTNLPNGSPSPTIRPVSVANSAISDIAPPRPPRAGRPPVSISPAPRHEGKTNPSRQSRISSSPDASSSEETDSGDGSPSRLGRQRTITKRSYRANSDLGHVNARAADFSHHQQTTSTRSELGHGSRTNSSHASPSPSRGPPPSSFQKSAEAVMGTRSFSVYRRQRASYSTSELNPSSAAQRASKVVEANNRELAAAQHQTGRDSDTSDSSSESDSSDDDAPLAALQYPKRPNSAFSHRSNGSSGAPQKPLIDLNLKFNPLSGKPIVDERGTEKQKGRPTLISPTNINGRLSQLTASAGLRNHHTRSASKSEANLSRMTSPRPSFVDVSKPDSPSSTNTITPPLRTESPEPITPDSRRASFSALSTTRKATQSMPDGSRPVAVKDRVERDTGFRVVSRPPKSATSPPSFIASRDSDPSRSSKAPVAGSHQRQSSSSTVTFNARLPASVSNVSTTPIMVGSQNGSPAFASGSSASGKTSSYRPVSAVQKPSERPFILGGKRQESPSSSTGGSSNGRGPLTPMDGSDYFNPSVIGSGDSPGGSSVGATPPSAMKGGRGHLKRASVSFQEPIDLSKDETVRGRKSSLVTMKTDSLDAMEQRENRLRERRRVEAKDAIELGNVVNGRGPIQQDDDNEDFMMAARMSTMGGMGLNVNHMQMGWQQQAMPSMIMGMGPMTSMTGAPGMGMGLNPAQFMIPPAQAGADPAFLVAHQQAMHIAKQAYQYAVAQQAMAAAADEWERGSSVSAFTAPGGGVGMGMGMGGLGAGGMNGMWGGGASMFPSGPRSMYAGSNGGGAMSEAGWGAASVYGESFGPSNARRSQVPNGHVRSTSGGGPASTIGIPSSYQRAESASNIQQSTNSSGRPPIRPRTKTAPSGGPLPPQHRLSRGPPSSWKVGL